MKKTFELTHPKIKYARRIDSVKNEIRKYIKRERKKELPEGVDFWDFDCKFGDTEAVAQEIHLAEIDSCIAGIAVKEQLQFYVEILAKNGYRTKKTNEDAAIQLKAAVREYKGFGSDDKE